MGSSVRTLVTALDAPTRVDGVRQLIRVGFSQLRVRALDLHVVVAAIAWPAQPTEPLAHGGDRPRLPQRSTLGARGMADQAIHAAVNLT